MGYHRNDSNERMANYQESAKIVIAGGGIVGCVLALALKKFTGIVPEIYEKARAFYPDIGAALGCYPNGLRVIRSIDPLLLQKIRDAGCPYGVRRWERHDGTEIAAAEESVLSGGEDDLNSIGIRRWRLQKVLFDAVLEAGIPFHFKKATKDVIMQENDMVKLVFEDGTSRITELLFGCDGAHSKVRQTMAGNSTKLEYTGITCLMGIADIPARVGGISFPSSTTTGCHGLYFPTGDNEQCFQMHTPVRKEDSDEQCWGNLDHAMGQEECQRLAERLRADGWDERYIEPLRHVTHAVRVGFALLQPPLKQWAYGKQSRVVLVGDAAHPPVPYLGQGAQMGIEDAGTIALLMKNLCVTETGKFDMSNFTTAADIYENLRIPRTRQMLKAAMELGETNEHRCNHQHAAIEESILEGELLLNDTLPIMFQGAMHNYQETVEVAMSELQRTAISPEEERLREAEIRAAYEEMLEYGS